MWQDKQAGLLVDEIEAILSSLADEANFYHLVKESLIKARRGLTNKATYDKPWPLLPLIVCEAVSGKYKRAMPVAAAIQLYIAAGDIFDDIEDADSSESLPARYGLATAVNVATTLLILAQKAITRLKGRGVADQIIARVMDTVNSLGTTACVGQYLDLTPTSEVAVSEDAYLRITGMKSASQIECACHVGALLATRDQELINTFAMFGYDLGIASQIANDIQGVTSGRDILKGKITLPVIYALSQADEKTRRQLGLTFGKQPESVFDTSQTRDLLFRSGAIHYATVKLEFYKQQALDTLLKTEAVGARIDRLRLFLE